MTNPRDPVKVLLAACELALEPPEWGVEHGTPAPLYSNLARALRILVEAMAQIHKRELFKDGLDADLHEEGITSPSEAYATALAEVQEDLSEAFDRAAREVTHE